MKRTVALAAAAALLLTLFSACGKKAPTVILAADGEPLSDYTGTLELYDAAFGAYARTALLEAAGALADQTGQAVNEVLPLLEKGGYTIRTAADADEILAAAEACAGFFGTDDAEYAVAVTDAEGRLTAICSGDGTIAPSYAGSVIKPLSVYGPCVEAGLMRWSSLQEDSPVKTVMTDSGAAPWPTNGSGRYGYGNVTAATALQDSLNTVAVRWLQTLGAEKAMDTLEAFGLDVRQERSIAALSGDDEVLGNLALGYLQAGVTVCDVAGCYRVFAKEGRYIPAYTVERIDDPAGKTVYEAAPEEKQIFSPQTAYILNRMLKNVVEKGTGTDARIPGCDVVGKTGTSDNYADNWFAGVTADRTVAVRHGPLSGGAGNRAAALFAAVFTRADLGTGETFAVPDGVEQTVYCPLSGLRVTDNCPGIEMGWFSTQDLPGPCDQH